jgi:hypothetical protein
METVKTIGDLDFVVGLVAIAMVPRIAGPCLATRLKQ